MLTGAPVGHGIGMLAALLTPVFRRRNVHLIDVWDPKRVLAAMVEDHLSAGQGATYFLTSLLDHPDFDPAVHGPLMAHIGLGGAAVPIAVCERARAIGIECTRSFGCTEHPSITGSTFEDPWEQRACTDGRPLPGVEMRLIGDDGRDVGVGEPGEIISRGPDCFFGYTDPARTAECFDADGWYATGDVGMLDEHGFLSITDRKKDIIIRGGENISAQEVEELIVRIPGVAECAVVGGARPAPRRARGGLRAHAVGARRSVARLRCVASRSRRPRPSEVARGGAVGRGVPAHTERQGAEVRAPAAAARRGAGA